MEWVAFLAGLALGYLLKSNPKAVEGVKAFAVQPLAKLKNPEKRAPKINDDRKAWAKEQERAT